MVWEWIPVAALLANVARQFAPAETAEAAPRAFVASRQIVIDYEAVPPGAPLGVWLAESGGPPRRTDAVRAGPRQLTLEVGDDGAFDVLIAPMVDGAVQAPPARLRVVVDTLPPVMQLHAVSSEPDGEQLRVEISATVLDENLGPDGVRLFVRPRRGAPWCDAGVLHVRGGRATVRLGALAGASAATLAREARIRVVATDLAGNQSADEADLSVGAATAVSDLRGSDEARTGARRPPGRTPDDMRVEHVERVALDFGADTEGESPRPPLRGEAGVIDRLAGLRAVRRLGSPIPEGAAIEELYSDAVRVMDAGLAGDDLRAPRLADPGRGRYADADAWLDVLQRLDSLPPPRALRSNDPRAEAGRRERRRPATSQPAGR